MHLATVCTHCGLHPLGALTVKFISVVCTLYGSHLLCSHSVWLAPTVFALTMECEHMKCKHSSCTYYGSHLLYIQTARESQEVYQSHRKCISSVRESGEMYLTHSKCMEQYQVWGSWGKCIWYTVSAWTHVTYGRVHGFCVGGHMSYHIVYGLILSAKGSQNLGWSALSAWESHHLWQNAWTHI